MSNKPIVSHFDGNRYAYVCDYLKGIETEKPLVIADVGAGSSIVREECENDRLQFHEFDLQPKCSRVMQWDIEQPCPKKFNADIVILMDVIEHLWNPGLGIGHLRDILRPNGTLLLSTPNPSWSRARVQFPFRSTIPCFTKNDLSSNHHVFTPWHHILLELLHKNGFFVEQHVTLESKLGYPKLKPFWSLPPRSLAFFAAKAIERHNPSALGINYLLVAHKLKQAA